MRVALYGHLALRWSVGRHNARSTERARSFSRARATDGRGLLSRLAETLKASRLFLPTRSHLPDTVHLAATREVKHDGGHTQPKAPGLWRCCFEPASRNLLSAGECLASQLGDVEDRFGDGNAGGQQRVPLALCRARLARDDRAGVAHTLARRRR